MPAEKAQALVLRTTDWSESSRIATLWTREFGKVRVLAKGGRRLKSNFENALDLLTLCRIVFLRKSSSSLDLLTEAQVLERFPRLRSDLSALYAAYYIAELLSDWTEDYDPHPVLFDEALATLRSLGEAEMRGRGGEGETRRGGEGATDERGKAETETTSDRPLAPSLLPPVTASPPPRVAPSLLTGPRLARFELVLLRELGYMPALTSCAVCGQELPPGAVHAVSGSASGDTSLAFSPAAGGVVCSACWPTRREALTLSHGAWQALRDLSEKEDAWRQSFSPEVRTEIRRLLNDYVTYLLGRRPRLLPYLGS
jgi:DNA repair protein RecO (recombination protein O)